MADAMKTGNLKDMIANLTGSTRSNASECDAEPTLMEEVIAESHS